MIERLAIGAGVSAVIALAGWRASALTGGGAVAAILIGTAIIGGASWHGAALLAAFFITSSALSRLPGATRVAEKDGRRDERQVLANGGIAAAAALSAPWVGEAPVIALVGGALAAATADTWATEIGTRWGGRPRLLLSRKPVVAGQSGGVTARGSMGSVAGAGLIGAVAAAVLLDIDRTQSPACGAVVMIAGLVGALADSVAGEVAQQRRRCPVCDEATEARVHHCGADTIPAGGWDWVDNDVVNVACTASGFLVAAFGAALFLRG